MDTLLLTKQQVAAALNLSESSVHRLSVAGHLVRVKSGKSARWHKADVEAYAQKLRAQAQAARE